MERRAKKTHGEPTMTDKTIERVDTGKVYLEQDGSVYFLKTIQTYQFLMVNQNGDNIYSKTATETQTEHVTPEQLGFTKKASWEIYVYKTEHEELEDKTVYYSMTLYFEIPLETRYRTAYFKIAKSGRVFLKWFDSSSCSEVSINDPEFCKRGKAKRLPEDTILQRNAPVFTLSSSGELERRLDSEAVW
jgi:hypothetical protein